MTSAETSATSFDPSFAEPKGRSLWRFLAPFAVGLALLSAFLTFVVLTGLTPIAADVAGCPFLHPDQRGHHPGAGRHHRPRGLAGAAGPPPRPGGGTAARPDCQPVFDHRGVAGRAGGDRRQCDHRSRSRPAVFRSDPRGDPELADHCPRLYARARRSSSAATSWEWPTISRMHGRCTTRIAGRFASF